MAKHHVTLVPGDTTGPELCAVVRDLVAALGVDIAWDEQLAEGGVVGDALVASAKRTKTVLMAHHEGHDPETPAPIVALRRRLGVHAELRPVHLLPGVTSRFSDVDLVVVREVTEDIYAGLEHESVPGVFESFKVTTRAACERIARSAFEFAAKSGRRRVTVVHKANIMKKADGLFLSAAQEVAAGYPDIEQDDCIVDALCMRLVKDPSQLDVLLCANLFGDIVADVCAGIGGATSYPSINFGADGARIYAAPHGDPPEAAGTGRADPLHLLLPAVPMLTHLGEADAARRLMGGILAALSAGVVPIALGGQATTAAFVDALRGNLSQA